MAVENPFYRGSPLITRLFLFLAGGRTGVRTGAPDIRSRSFRLAAILRERERASPRLLVRALEDPQSIAALPDQQAGHLSLPVVAIKTRAGTFTVLFDRTTRSH
jgi:hypothetical protein